MKQHVLITGATGTVGREALKQLCQRGNTKYLYCVVVLQKYKNTSPYLNNIDIIDVDLSVEKELQKLNEDL